MNLQNGPGPRRVCQSRSHSRRITWRKANLRIFFTKWELTYLLLNNHSGNDDTRLCICQLKSNRVSYVHLIVAIILKLYFRHCGTCVYHSVIRTESSQPSRLPSLCRFAHWLQSSSVMHIGNESDISDYLDYKRQQE